MDNLLLIFGPFGELAVLWLIARFFRKGWPQFFMAISMFAFAQLFGGIAGKLYFGLTTEPADVIAQLKWYFVAAGVSIAFGAMGAAFGGWLFLRWHGRPSSPQAA